MRRLAGVFFDAPKRTIAAWLVILGVLMGTAIVVGTDYQFDVNLDDTESVQAFTDLTDHDPDLKTDQLTIAWRAPSGALSPEVRPRIEAFLGQVAAVDDVSAIRTPWSDAQTARTQVSGDGRTALANVAFADPEVPDASIREILRLVDEMAASPDLTVGVTGSPIDQAAPPTASASEVVGFVIAGVILLLAFGSLVAAALPMATALIALGAGLAVVMMATHVLSIPSFAPQMVSLISIGVGIDYALFVVSRHRSDLKRGMSVREAAVHALDSSGRAVIFAGITVVIALLGMVATGIGFLTGLAVATSIGVLFTMLVTISLLPALLALIGERVLSRRERARLRESGPNDEAASNRWASWAQVIQQRPWPFIAAAIGILLVLSIPAASLRLGMSDAGTDAPGTAQRVGYDLISDGFGPGFNGPLLLVSPDVEALSAAATRLVGRDGVAFVSPPQTTPDGAIATVTVVPTTGPQDEATDALIESLRSDLAGSSISVSGIAAVYYDFSRTLQDRLPWFLVGVLGLSSVLLLVAFRSIAIPVKAALMNLLAAGASFGVLVVVSQWGWLGALLGIDRTGPVDAFLPILLLAVLFGLSMDYQVFLVSRMREEWITTRDNTRAVTIGLAQTGRVITAAALIMIAVFTSFVFGSDRIIKLIGLGLAVAIFLDAFVIRSLLVPALMRVLGDWNWWLPRWLDRLVPRVAIEPSTTPEPVIGSTYGSHQR